MPRTDDLELPIRSLEPMRGPAIDARHNRKEDDHSEAEERRRQIAEGFRSAEPKDDDQRLAVMIRALREFDPQDWVDGWLTPDEMARAVLDALDRPTPSPRSPMSGNRRAMKCVFCEKLLTNPCSGWQAAKNCPNLESWIVRRARQIELMNERALRRSPSSHASLERTGEYE